MSRFDSSERKYIRGVQVKKYENIDFALKRLKRMLENEGITNEWRERECYVKPSMQNKRKRAAAVKREERRFMENDMKARGIVIKSKKDKKESRNQDEDREVR